ncbi:hypothetical protein Hanom_Chr06g00485621 [Helianthus anomalus]
MMLNRKPQREEDCYFKVYAPPALTLPQSLQPQIPTAFLLTAYYVIEIQCIFVTNWSEMKKN